MKGIFHFLVFLSLFFVMLYMSCVTYKKIYTAETLVVKTQKEIVNTNNQFDNFNAQIKNDSNVMVYLQNKNMLVNYDLQVLTDELKLTFTSQEARLKNYSG